MPTFTHESVPTNLALTEIPAPKAGTPATPGVSGKPARMTGSLQFSVINGDRRSRVCRLTVEPTPPAQVGWFSFKEAAPTASGPFETDFEPGAKRMFTVVVTIPPDAPPGQYVFTVRAAAIESDPDNDFSRTSAVAFTIPEAKPVETKATPFPWKWAAIAAVVLIALVGGGAYVAFAPGGQIAVPKVTNLDVVEATKQLNDGGLQAVADLQPSTQKAGTVISTAPNAGTMVDRNSQVKLAIAYPQSSPNPCASRAATPPALTIFCGGRIRLQNRVELNTAIQHLSTLH